MSEAPIDQLTATRKETVPVAIQDKFTRFVHEIGSGEFVRMDPSSLRLTRKPYVLPSKVQTTRAEEDLSALLDLSPETLHDETIEYFYYNPHPGPGGFDFEHLAEAAFSVGEKRTELSSIQLNNPEGDRFVLRILKDHRNRYGRKLVKMEGKTAKSAVAYQVLYDYGTGRLITAELTSARSGRKASVDFTEEGESITAANERDANVGKTVILQDGPSSVLLLRVPETQDFAETLGSAFPSDTFKDPSSTNRNSDGTWRGKNWQSTLLHIQLSQNGQTIPLSL